MAPMIRERVDIRSRCHHCGDPLAMTVEPEGPLRGADGIMVWIGMQGSNECRLATGL
jgi:hypothetical protein